LVKETGMTNKRSSTIAVAIALGISFGAMAQTAAPTGSNPGNVPATGSTATTGTKSGDRVPANRPDDPTAACASVPATDKEACMARENARRSGTAPSSATSGSTQGKGTSSNSGAGTGMK
jgi:hypothetical protein